LLLRDRKTAQAFHVTPGKYRYKQFISRSQRSIIAPLLGHKLLAQIAVQIFLHQPATTNISYIVANALKPYKLNILVSKETENTPLFGIRLKKS